MVSLRIEEIAEGKGLTLAEVREIAGISEEMMQKYANKSIKITEETAADLKKIAEKLNVPVMELIKPVAKQAAFKLTIFEKAKEKGITLEELSEKSGVHLALVAFYSTQVISKEKLAEEPYQKYLTKISEALECNSEDLKVVAELPVTRLRLEEMAKEKGLSLEEISRLNKLPWEFVDLMATQPVDANLFLERLTGIIDCAVSCAIHKMVGSTDCNCR